MTTPTLLESLEAAATNVLVWDEMRLRVSAYLCDAMPPDELISSVRAVVHDGDRIAVVFNANGCQPLPGGRRAPGENLLETLRREVHEETGCMIGQPELLGFIHFEHLTPEPTDYAYPYPHFFQVVYRASVVEVGTAVDPDGYDERVEFLHHEQVPFDQSLPIVELFVQLALRVHHASAGQLGAAADRSSPSRTARTLAPDEASLGG